jgi:hypothetical protein
MKQPSNLSEDRDAEPFEGFNELRETIAERRILEHKDPKVRTYAACIIADMFRVIAPKQPFEEHDFEVRYL